ncbi:unnamed protein product [Lactuca saligna]|uniref:BED-type domain-containing protein n=1 Tax=Lactuca saligna TaxID=75948 RepID=A0AA35VHP5_LACSI|nr:unnamed protein product [Lactuca saligna]
MNIVDEADIHQFRNVMSEMKEIVNLYLEVFEGCVEQTNVVDKIVSYNVDNIISDNAKECSREETMAIKTVEEENLYEFGRLVHSSSFVTGQSASGSRRRLLAAHQSVAASPGHWMSNTDDYIEVEDETIEVENPTNDQVPQEKQKKAKEFNPRSKVWKEFERYKDENGVQRCKCKHCGGGNYKCESSGYGTKNLGYHLTKCKAYLDKLSGGQKQLTFQYGDENKLSTWKFDQNESRKALAHMLVVDELPFSFVEESHRGVDIGKMVEKCLMEWEIENIFTISVDNASANDVAIDFLKKSFQNSNTCLLNGKWMHIRCVAHILNLVVQDGLKKVDKAVEIVRWAVKWIRQSPSRIHKFTDFAKVANPGITKHLKRDVPTRWNSTYHMLEIAQGYEKTFERYDLEEFDFRYEIEKAGLSIPSSSDWERVRNICHFLKPFHDVTLRISGTLYVTSNTCIEDIYSIRTLLDDAISDSTLCDIALAMKKKFDKYFGDVEKMNLLLYFALILDPRNKVKYLVILLEDRYGENGVEAKKKYIMDSMYELYNDYIRIHSPISTSSTAESTTSSSILGKRQNPDFMAPNPPLRNKLREKMKTNIVESIGELEKYFQESVEDDLEMFNILDWWKVNSPRFPILSLMARDVFAIPVSTVASESVFSTSGRVLDPFRSSLTPKIVESLICTQDWIRGSISDTIDYEKDWEENQQIDKDLSKMV